MSRERILVIDDEPAVRGIVGALLDRCGYIPTLAGGAIEGLAAMREHSGFDMVLCDVMMPGIDGLSLLDSVGRDYPGTPVVLFTAVHDIHVATNAFRRGAFDYLLKPFERTQLAAVVTRAIEQGRVRRQNSTYLQNLEEIVSARTERLRATMHDLELSYDVTLEAMGDALDLRDAETQGHSKRVTTYTTALAKAMGVGQTQLKVIARGAFLHDIGKIATPDAILLKAGRLTAAETAIMRRHCERGYEMVRKIPFLADAAEIVYSHQESFDGSGYPRQLKGEEIPLGARIFAVADTLDAITSDRPYRKGASVKQARIEIARCAGTQFDPLVVDAFVKMPEQLWIDLRDEVLAQAAARPQREQMPS